MALTKTITIDDQAVTFRASAAVPRIYRIKFRRDIYKDLDALQKAIDTSKEEASIPVSMLAGKRLNVVFDAAFMR